MMSPKFIEHDEDVVILTKSEYNDLQKENSALKAQVKFFQEMEKSSFRQRNDGETHSLTDLKEKLGWV
ncbi:hypothetical protein [Pseudolactococcus insecticola]|uniref:Uncharacterized protein n=1 Tax=Pseudolactococcus insecticola TaxID=2709158 RepID=A0A6A0B8S5_9LACT|nr:hypothetical protein [Lactococcus insecticola]GFH40841.1 hypothetical protein Hs20B_12390 [Lactococcus insecticola]